MCSGIDRLAGECSQLGVKLAFTRERKRCLAFLWPQNQGTPTASFRWVVCFSNGECRQGTEQTMEECEKNATKVLME